MVLAHGDAVATAPPSLSIASFFTEARLEILPAVLVALLALAYVVGVHELRGRGRRWPVGRSTAFGFGVVALAVATQSGLAAYDSTLFSAHVAQHVLLGVVAPFLLALGAPITLALQAAPRDAQVRMLRVLKSGPVRLLTNPIVAWALFGLSLFVLYFSPIYELSLRNVVVHELVHVHFLVAGSVFFWAVIGLDPVAWRIPYGFRLLLVLLTVPFHAFLGLALMSGETPIAVDFYEQVARPVGSSLLSDQRTGAGIMWAIGDLIGVVAGTVVLMQWMRHEDRAGRRADAIEDRRRAMAGIT